MATEPITFSMAFGIESSAVLGAGVVDVTLNCDTNLFIDPVLLEDSFDNEFSTCAHTAYVRHFESIIDLLSQSQAYGDFAWRNAERLFLFPEGRFTHLGYSNRESGSGFGPTIRASLMGNCREAIRLGIRNPNLFLVLALFEEGVGADRISDMVTRIIQPCLCQFTARVAGLLGIVCETFELNGERFQLPRNPLIHDRTPIILVPKDVVRDLPMASDWHSVSSAAQQTEELRERVSRQVGEIWAAKTRRQKEAIRTRILQHREAFQEFLDLLERAESSPYDIREDHLGEIYPADLRRHIAEQSPLDLTRFSSRRLSPSEVNQVVSLIIGHFQTLIEQNGLWDLLYDDDRITPRREKAAQRLFFAVASAYCIANNLDLSPEADSGCGPVDFKVSQGAESKVIVELKKSTNTKLVNAYDSQLGAYAGAERPYASHYVVVDVGRLTQEKRLLLSQMRDDAIQTNGKAPKIWFIDALPQESASRR